MAGSGDLIHLFRAVLPLEMESIETLRRFTNPPGLTVKYFALTLDGARRYAAMAGSAFGDGPFVIVSSSIPESLVTWEERVMVDRGIESLAVPTMLLGRLRSLLVLGPA